MKRVAQSEALAGVLFFWDYDTQWGEDRSRRGDGPKGWGRLEFENTERLLELHAEYGIPACFAVVGSAALPGARPYHDPQQIREIHAQGHEVASHSHQHEWLPGLSRPQLINTLRESKDALEQCIDAEVRTFVPPYNQPYDYAAGWSISLSERREAGATRTDLYGLCSALRETGYQFCRVAYRPLGQRLQEQIWGRRLDRPARLEQIAGVDCIRINSPGGFDGESLQMIQRTVAAGGLVVIHGHPHALRTGNSQDEKFLVPFFAQIRQLRSAGKLRVHLPREIIAARKSGE